MVAELSGEATEESIPRVLTVTASPHHGQGGKRLATRLGQGRAATPWPVVHFLIPPGWREAPLLSKEQERWTQGAGPCCGRAACGRDGCGADAAHPPGTSPPRERPRPEPPPCGCRCSPVECQDGLGSGLQARSIAVPLTARARAELSEPLKAAARGRAQAGLADVRCVTGTPPHWAQVLVLLTAGSEWSSHGRKAKPEAAAMRARSSREGPAAASPTPNHALLTRTPCVTLGPTGPGV